jgi:ribonuclease P protein component
LLYYIDKEQQIGYHQACFTVPKKKCKSAVVRNRLKRIMREAHRLNKDRLGMPTDLKFRFLLGYIYVGDPRLGDFHTIQKRVVKALEWLVKIGDKEKV